MTEREKNIESIFEALEGPPPFIRKAFGWLMDHLKLAQELCQGSPPLSEDEFEAEIKKAVKTQDYAYFALLVFQRSICP